MSKTNVTVSPAGWIRSWDNDRPLRPGPLREHTADEPLEEAIRVDDEREHVALTPRVLRPRVVDDERRERAWPHSLSSCDRKID
jgi:hypothetical protein